MEQDEELIAKAKAFVDEVWEDVVADIDYLVQVNSVEDKTQAAAGAPFGPGPRESLTRGLAVASRLGLEPHDCDGYIGYADLVGASDTYLATIAHSDIVPVGTGWSYDPLRVTRKEGYLLGRGVLDDKGPLILSLYAAHFFVRQARENGKQLPYTLRCIVGTNEETGMEDVEYYLQHFPEPAFCFTPDAVYPLICGEKGRFGAEVCSGIIADDGACIVSLEGGTVPNAIPGEAHAVVRREASTLPAAEGIELVAAGHDERGTALTRVVAHGKGGHASLPEGTQNAIGMLVSYLLDNGICSEDERPFLEFESVLLADTDGKALGVHATDDLFDPLTCIGGTIRTQETEGGRSFTQSMDMRYPKSTTAAQLLQRVSEVAASKGCKVTDWDDMVPFYVSPDSDEINALVGTYNQITGRDAQAFTIGGGTYARHFKRAAAFGPDDPAYPAPAWIGQEHGPDEGVAEESLRRALVIYIVGIARLMRLSY